SLLGFGLGSINAIMKTYWAAWRSIEPILMRPLFLMSGVFYTPQMFPTTVSDLLSWNPVIHGIELIRSGYYDGYRTEFIDVSYLLGWAIALPLAGLAAERFLPRRE